MVGTLFWRGIEKPRVFKAWIIEGIFNFARLERETIKKCGSAIATIVESRLHFLLIVVPRSALLWFLGRSWGLEGPRKTERRWASWSTVKSVDPTLQRARSFTNATVAYAKRVKTATDTTSRRKICGCPLGNGFLGGGPRRTGLSQSF